ncbi:MAG: alpha/beta fold hydrolase [Jatrophihabitans sp.]|uniref:alpha/beta fold hydrolase n=1 Tax=Jatrophihabitans sp. TaxID=1932789 RepID=UPI003F80BC8E
MVPELRFAVLHGSDDATRLLVVGPSLGTAVAPLWRDCAGRLPADVQVLGLDLPGHGDSRPSTEPFTVEDLAAAVRERVVSEHRPVTYAGVSLGGAIGFALAVDPGRVAGVVTIAAAPRIGEPAAWHERAAKVRAEGTASLVDASVGRWFAPGFAERRPGVAQPLLASLVAADDESYAQACEALAAFDRRGLQPVVPLLVTAGTSDPVVPPEQARAAVPGARFHEFTTCGHLPPAEDPAAVAAVLGDVLVATAVTR